VAAALFRGDYEHAAEAALLMATSHVPNNEDLSDSGIVDPDYQRKIQSALSNPAKMTWAILLAIVPLGFTLATMKLKGAPEEELAAAIDATDSAFEENDQRQAIVTSLRTAMLDTTTDWSELQDHANQLASHADRLGERMIYLLGAAIRSPLDQALYLQTWMARKIEKLFQTYRSIRIEIIYPFFKAFWIHVASTHPHEFRTAPSFTKRSIEAAEGSSIHGIKQLLKSMAFCLGVSMREDIADWLEAADESGQ
jgi:hypothetical protein